jgi:hypothetical protein
VVVLVVGEVTEADERMDGGKRGPAWFFGMFEICGDNWRCRQPQDGVVLEIISETKDCLATSSKRSFNYLIKFS